MLRCVKCWLRLLVMALAVAGCVVQARAAMSQPTQWTDLQGFLSRMVVDETGQPQYFDKMPVPSGLSGDASGYGFTVATVGTVKVLTFIGSPTGVGAFFKPGTSLTFTFSDSSSRTVSVPATGFVGYTTDVYPSELSILSLKFGSKNSPSRLLAGLDTVPVPEVTTLLAGALLLLPFGVSTVRGLRRKH